MNCFKHVGIYVDNLEKESDFYKKTFQMSEVITNNFEQNEMLNDLFKNNNVEILTTKLITPEGKKRGVGDMIELIKVCSFQPSNCYNSHIYQTGTLHFAFGVDDIHNVCNLVLQNGGQLMTDVHKMKNNNMCAFIKDPEGNWIELIQNI